MTPAPLSRATTIGSGVSLGLAGLLLAASWWNPLRCIPVAVLFLLLGLGIRRRKPWYAAGGLPLILLPILLHPYVMASGSMARTLSKGDYVLMRPLAGSDLSRGDVVQLRYPIDRKQIWVKRIVAVGGDRLHFRDKTLILNGRPVAEPYVIHESGYIDNFRDNFPAEPTSPLPGGWAELLRQSTVNGELVIPPGKFFVLGDNRDDSMDSRYFGFVDRSDVVGKPVVMFRTF
jgi:signal peptidase I